MDNKRAGTFPKRKTPGKFELNATSDDIPKAPPTSPNLQGGALPPLRARSALLRQRSLTAQSPTPIGQDTRTSWTTARASSIGCAVACHQHKGSGTESPRRPRSIAELRKLTREQADELTDPLKLARTRTTKQLERAKSVSEVEELEGLSMNDLWKEINNCRYIRKKSSDLNAEDGPV